MTTNDTPNAPGAIPDDAATRGVRQWALLSVLSGNMLLDAIEVSIVLVALPTVGEAMGMSVLTVQSLISGFAIGFLVLLLLGNWVTAWWGRRRTYLVAMAVFVIASAVGGVTGSAALLVATRVVKGCCAALTAPSGLAIIGTTFRGGSAQRKAVSVYSMFGATGFTAGLLLSAVLLTSTWRWTFFLPAPIAMVLLLSAMRLIPADAKAEDPKPRIKLRLLRDTQLRRSALGAATLNGTYISLLLLVTFQLQRQLHWSPWQNALALLPACAPLIAAVPFAGRLVARWGTHRLITLGALAPFLGYAFYTWSAPTDWYWGTTLPTLLLVEAGFVLSFAALNMQSMATIPSAERGLAVPLYQSGVQLGALLMLPLVALLLTVSESYRPALALITAVSAAGVVTALRGIHSKNGRQHE